MKVFTAVLFLSGILLISLSCAPPATTPSAALPAEALPKAAPQPLTPQAVAAPWEQEWDKTIQAAQKEGKVVIYSSAGAVTRRVLSPAFSNKYKVGIEFVMGTSGEINERLLREHRAGLYLVDLVLSNPSPTIYQLKPAGVVDKLEPTLILPEVLDKGKWLRGELPWADEDKTILAFLAFPTPAFVINTTMAQVGEFKSWRDLLNPKWKGKITIQDPTISGAGWAWFSTLIDGKIMDLDYMRELAKQEPMITRDWRLHVDWVAKGKHAIAIAPKSDTVVEYLEAGAPLKYIMPKEGIGLTPGSGGLQLIKNRPHPGATTLFVNWMLSKEGVLLFTQAHRAQSARLDLPVDFIPEEKKRQPDINYFWPTEEYYLRAPEHFKMAKEVFGHLIK